MTRESQIVLEFASTQPEREVLDGWVRRERADQNGVHVVTDHADELALALDRDGAGDPLVTPVRVAWLPRERRGARTATLADLVAGRNPRRPTAAAQRRILSSEPDRCVVVAGEPATAGELRKRFERAGGGDFAAFVSRQGALAVERAERNLIGTQYKVPRFIAEEICASVRFRDAVSRLAADTGRPEAEVEREAASYVDEMAAGQTRLAIDVWGQFGAWLSRAYEVEADRTGFARLRELNREHPLVFLPSHRSYIDPLVLRIAMHGQGFPPSHVFGGMNVGFWPLGPVARRSGYVFIRRSFRDNEAYKLALRQYMAYLMGKRFNLEWYIEGGRSRTGKLRPPRYGLLSYLVEAFEGGGVDDALLIPTSIVYDQLHEVRAMAAEERGATKTPEGIGWLVGYARAQGRRLGHAHVEVGEPLSLRAALADTSAAGSRRSNRVEKVAFEVCYRIGQATPVTPGSLVTLGLLGVEDRALTAAEVEATLAPLVDYVEARELPIAASGGESLDLRAPETVPRTLDALVSGGIVSRFEGGLEPVYSIGPERHLEAAFYRNGAIHFFVNRAIAELVVVRASEEEAASVMDSAWEQALRLRDLLKFDFFFARKRDFSDQIRAEMTLLDPDWESKTKPELAQGVLGEMRAHLAHRVLRPFLEAYQVVADRLAEHPRSAVDRDALLNECIGVAQQYRLQRRLHSPESISKEIFASALRLAANRGLLEAGGDALQERRQELAAEIRSEVRRVERVRDLALRELGSPA